MALLTTFNRLLITFAIGLVALGALWFMAANIYGRPYYRVHNYSVVPPEACPNAEVNLQIDRSIYQDPLVKRGGYTLEPTSWLNLATGQRVVLPAIPGDLSDTKPGRTIFMSPYLRTAPGEPGRWRLEVVMTLQGRVLGWPRKWTIPYATRDYLTVLEPDSEACLDVQSLLGS